MQNTSKSQLWVDVGYNLFAKEGMDGLQIERLARILQLNKSGFYHHFGDFDGYLEAISKSHRENASNFTHKLLAIEKLDPDYLLLLIEFATPVMFQVQAARCRQNYPRIYELGELVDETVNAPIGKLFGDFIGIEHRPDLAAKYYSLVRDMFYSRANLQDFTYEFLSNLHLDAKSLILQISDSRKFDSLEGGNQRFRDITCLSPLIGCSNSEKQICTTKLGDHGKNEKNIQS